MLTGTGAFGGLGWTVLPGGYAQLPVIRVENNLARFPQFHVPCLHRPLLHLGLYLLRTDVILPGKYLGLSSCCLKGASIA